jgi:phospholipid/cholesterol/gamma-HCH transport system substrate-binding protein
MMNLKFFLSGGGITLALVLCVFYIFGSVLKTPLLESAPTIKVEMPRTGGLFKGSEATFRGVRVGKVTNLDLGKNGVEATVKLGGGVKIPADSKVAVRSLSPVGEQYLDFQPDSMKGPYLREGSVVQASAVDLPQTLGNMAITLNKLIEQIQPSKVRVILDEVATGLGGAERDLQTLVQNGSELINTLNQNWPVTERLLRNGNVLLRIGADNTTNILRIARNSKLFASWLRRYDPTLFRLLDRAPGQIEQLRKVIRDARETLPQLLDPAITLSDVFAAHDPHIRELLVQFPRGFNALAGALRDGAGHLDVILQRTETCDYPTVERSPRATTRRPLQDKGYCSKNLRYSQRGAQWAPGPVPVPR